MPTNKALKSIANQPNQNLVLVVISLLVNLSPGRLGF